MKAELASPASGFAETVARSTGEATIRSLESGVARAAYVSINAAYVFGERVCGAFQRWRMERQTVRELSALDNHVLKDIGLSRGDIHWIARQVSQDPGYVHGPRNV